MSYAFPPDVDRLVRTRMATGNYRSEDDLLRHALEALADQEDDAAAVEEALAELAGGDPGLPLEEAFRETLRRAFADGPLRRRWLLRAKARAFMHFDFSWVYHMARRHRDAWLHTLLALILYPLPDWDGKVFQRRFARWRRLLRYTITPNQP